MNIDQIPYQELRKMFGERLKDLLAEVFPEAAVEFDSLKTPDRSMDLTASVSVPDCLPLELRVAFRAQPRPSQVPEIPRSAEITEVTRAKPRDASHHARRGLAWVFAAPFVSPRLAEVCREKGWGWFDLAGNCQIRIPGLLYLERKGYEPVHTTSRPEANLGTLEASRVLRVLLQSNPRLRVWKSQRELQQATEPQVSLGLVNKIVTHLRNEGYLAKDENGGLRVVETEKLLYAWRDAYRFDRLPRLELFTLLKAPEIEEIIRQANRQPQHPLAWAVFSAAERLAPTVHQSKYWLMSADGDTEALRDRLGAKRVDTGANLTLLVAPERSLLAHAHQKSGPATCTSPLQTYLDLWHAGGRGQEAAEAILEQQLKPRWK